MSKARIIYGRHPVSAYLKGAGDDQAVAAVYLGEHFPRKLGDELRKKFANASFHELPRKELDRLYPGLRHQGVVLEFHEGAPMPGEAEAGDDWHDIVRERNGLIILLDRIQDPHNLGSIIRSAEALGARCVFVTGQGAPVNETVHKVSSGASLRLPLFRKSNLAQLLDALKDAGYWICAAAAREDLPEDLPADHPVQAHTELGRLPEAQEIALIIGSEGDGVKTLSIKRSDYVITIDLPGDTESLNAGVAAGILIDRIVHR